MYSTYGKYVRGIHTMKKCNKCNIYKEYNEFHYRKNAKDGYSGYCRNCKNEIRRKYIRGNSIHINATIRAKNKKQEYVNEIKKSGCINCGYTKCLKALTFHHINPKTKLNTISNLVCSGSLQNIIDEIAKCIILCQNCHHELHDKLDNEP